MVNSDALADGDNDGAHIPERPEGGGDEDVVAPIDDFLASDRDRVDRERIAMYRRDVCDIIADNSFVDLVRFCATNIAGDRDRVVYKLNLWGGNFAKFHYGGVVRIVRFLRQWPDEVTVVRVHKSWGAFMSVCHVELEFGMTPTVCGGNLARRVARDIDAGRFPIEPVQRSANWHEETNLVRFSKDIADRHHPGQPLNAVIRDAYEDANREISAVSIGERDVGAFRELCEIRDDGTVVASGTMVGLNDVDRELSSVSTFLKFVHRMATRDGLVFVGAYTAHLRSDRVYGRHVFLSFRRGGTFVGDRILARRRFALAMKIHDLVSAGE